MSESVDLHYSDDNPAWVFRVPQPDRFRGVDYDIRVQNFALPTGTLLGMWLRLYDVPDQPYFVHRVLSWEDEAVVEYIEAVVRARRIVLVVRSTGEGGDLHQELSVDKVGFPSLRTDAHKWLAQGHRGDDEAALDAFMDVFNAALEKSGNVGSAWKAVLEQYPLPED